MPSLSSLPRGLAPARTWPLLAAALLAGCDDGEISVRLTDAPADFAVSVVLAVRAVELERADGNVDELILDPALEVDVATLRDGQFVDLVSNISLERGDFRNVRIRFETAEGPQSPRVTLEDSTLLAVEFDQARATAPVNFTLDRGDSRTITVDLDLRRSLRLNDDDIANQRIRLHPHARASVDDNSGLLQGQVATNLINQANCLPAVYLYQGRNAQLRRLSDSSGPYASTLVFDAQSNPRYAFHFVPDGEYTVAYTCDALNDDPEDASQPVNFGPSGNVRVRANQTTTANIE